MQIKSMIMENPASCSGCSACANICPYGAVIMKTDKEGFLYPEIEKEKCVSCGLCAKHCPSLNKHKNVRILAETEAYAYQNSDEIRQSSSSGGAFSALAEEILRQDGCVFGVGFDKNWQVVHKKAISVETLEELRRSKYVQSKIGTTYQEVKKELVHGRKVLFTGTACQVAGLNSFLQKEYANLLTVDVVCHGVPSPLVWEKYLGYRKGNKNIKNISFRNKDVSWEQYALKIQYQDDSCYQAVFGTEPYGRAFLKNITLRPSCFQCKFRYDNRQADITLADFWGIDEVIAGFNDHKGLSAVILNTAKGRQAFAQIAGTKKKTDVQQVIRHNVLLKTSVEHNPKRELFFTALNSGLYENIEQLLCLYSLDEPQSLWKKIKKILKHRT